MNEYNDFPLYYRIYKKIYSVGGKIISSLINIIIVLLIVLGITSTVANLAFGYKTMFVMTNSMVPTLKVHQLIVGQELDEDDTIELGDICTYEASSGDYTITHRVIAVYDNGTYVFKGDNNEKQDTYPVSKDRIKYKIILY